MWYAVETAFVNGNQYKSVPLFDPKADDVPGRILPGTCMAGHHEEPHNTCQTFLKGLIEIHTDWFQTKEQAMQFINGGITYIAHYRSVYRPAIKSEIRTFLKWETVPALGEILPYRGVYKYHKEREQIRPQMEARMEAVQEKAQNPVKEKGQKTTFTVNEIINWVHSGYKDQLVKAHHIEADSEDAAFRKVYALRRSGRYDSARRYDFEDPSLEEKYRAWKAKNETVDMYYGSGTVD